MPITPQVEQVVSTLPDGGAAVLIIRRSAAPDVAAVYVIDIAAAVARSRNRTLLANLDIAIPGVDQALGARPGAGISQALLGQAKISGIVHDSRRGFQLLPAGSSPRPLRDVVGPRLGHLVEMTRLGGGTLLLYADEEALAPDVVAAATALNLDGVITLGPEGTEVSESYAAPLLGHVATQAVEADLTLLVPPNRTITRRRLQTGPGVPQIVGIWATAALLVWLAFQAYAGWPMFGQAIEAPLQELEAASLPNSFVEESTDEATETEIAVDSADNAGLELPSDATSPQPATGTRSAVLHGPPAALRVLPAINTRERPYSVLIASYVRWEDALAHVDELERGSTDVAFIAPTPVRQRVYYRVLSGALQDAAEAEQYMLDLVSSGRKEEHRRWDMRPVRLAYVIGDFRTLAEAYAEKSRLRGDRIPAYVLQGGSDGLPFRVYSGAFESTSAAADLGSRLSQAGHDVKLETRRGTHP